MYLVLGDPWDGSAAWAARGLHAMGLVPLEFVTSEELGRAVHLEHRLNDSEVSVKIELLDGRLIASERLSGVLNRLTGAPSYGWDGPSTDDRVYASAELNALFTSCLFALPGCVLNRPTPHGLGGSWRPASEWVSLAARAGLAVEPFTESSEERAREVEWSEAVIAPSHGTRVTLFAVDGRCVGPPAPEAVQQGCLRLAELAGSALLGVDFADGDDEWWFAGASAHPQLEAGGLPLLEELARALRRTP